MAGLNAELTEKNQTIEREKSIYESHLTELNVNMSNLKEELKSKTANIEKYQAKIEEM